MLQRESDGDAKEEDLLIYFVETQEAIPTIGLYTCCACLRIYVLLVWVVDDEQGELACDRLCDPCCVH